MENPKVELRLADSFANTKYLSDGRYKGDYTKGEIEIVTDAEEIKQNLKPHHYPLGEVYKDKFITINKDAVRFANGQYGSYLNIDSTVSSDAGHSGSAVLAHSEGKFLLISIFRHSLRRKSLEIPRGFSEGETDIETALREVREETGYSSKSITTIGVIAPDTGTNAGTVAIYFAELDTSYRAEICTSEGTEEQKFYSSQEIDEFIASGEIVDSFTLAAITLARARKFII